VRIQHDTNTPLLGRYFCTFPFVCIPGYATKITQCTQFYINKILPAFSHLAPTSCSFKILNELHDNPYPHPKISPTLKLFHLKPHNAIKIPTTSTTTNTAALLINFGQKIRYNIRCLLKCPAHIVVAKLVTA
jgi:hypothetical protein